MWLGIVAALVAIVVGAFVWGWLRLRRSMAEVRAAIAGVRLEDVPRLRDECEQLVRAKFSETLALDQLEASAGILARRIADGSLKRVFARDDFWWYFVLPVGAYVGELLRVHAKGEWRRSDDDGGLEMVLPVRDGTATVFPFDKVLKQATTGEEGDLLAYLVTASQLERALER